jgi:hypothetical protein
MNQSTAGKFLGFISDQIIDWKKAPPVSLPRSEDELNELLESLDKLMKVFGDLAHGLGHVLDAVSMAKAVKALEPNSHWAKSLEESSIRIIDVVQMQVKHQSQSQVIYRGLHEFLADKLRQEYANGVYEMFLGLDRCFALSTELESARFGELFAKQLEVTMPLAIALARFRAGLVSEPPDIPPKLMTHISGIADILKDSFGRTDSDAETEDDDAEEEDDVGRSSQEVISELIQRSHEIRAGCEQVRRCMRELRRQVVIQIAIGTKPRPVKGEYNRRMLERMQQDLACIGWSVEIWAQFLGCSKSTVHSQPAWKSLLKMREQLKRDRFESENRIR